MRRVTIDVVRRLTVSALLAASVLAVSATSAPPADAATPRTVSAELRGLLVRGAIDQARHDAWLGVYVDAKRTLKALRGARHVQLAGVLENLRDLAARRRITSGRAPLAFLTVERNRQWWASSPLLRYGQRVAFPGSGLVWQFYPGQGIQVQWLGTFGNANALAASRTRTAELTQLVDEAVALAVPRAGGIAWESMFRFNGGRPPWVSGLSQGTAIQALARAAGRLSRPDLMQAARAGLGVFRTAPPEGVRVATAAGAHYVQYSYAPALRILNGFTQAVNGLHDYAQLSADAEGTALFAAGEAELRAELPSFDTGAWSLYSQFGEATLDYHKLARDFLRALCRRLEADVTAQVPSTPDPAVYCAADQRFTTYLTEPPVIALRSTRARAKATRSIRFTLNKVSTVTVTVTRRDTVIMSRSVRFGRGTRSFDFRPDRAGEVQVRLRAVDLAGNPSEVSGDIEVLPARRRR